MTTMLTEDAVCYGADDVDAALMIMMIYVFLIMTNNGNE